MNIGKFIVTQWQTKGDADWPHSPFCAEVTLKSVVRVPCAACIPSELRLYVGLGADLHFYDEALRTGRIFELMLNATEEVFP